MINFFGSSPDSRDAALVVLLAIVISGSCVYTIDGLSTFSTLPSVANTQTAVVYFSTGTVLKVGPAEMYTKVSQAYNAAVDGDTIEIAAGEYSNDPLCVNKNNLTFRGVGGLAHMKVFALPGNTLPATNKDCPGKGIWVMKGSNNIIENLEFSGAAVGDHNGAGIRIESLVEKLTIRGSYFHHNENGIMGGGTGAVVLIEKSEFAFNGRGDGLTHNMYFGPIASLTLLHIYSHDAKVGHNVKTRSRNTYIYASRITDEVGNPSYGIDISGGRAYIIGNILEKSPLSSNPTTVINYYTVRDPDGPHELYVVHNTIVSNTSRYFVYARSGIPVYAKVVNNLFIGALAGNGFTDVSIIDNKPADDTNVIENNIWIKSLAHAKLVDMVGYNYRLTPDSEAINAGMNMGNVNGVSLKPRLQYVHKANGEQRSTIGRSDIPEVGLMTDVGAYEFKGAPTNFYPPPIVDFTATPTGTDTSSTLSWNTNALTCSASDGWTGSKPADGRENSGLIAQSTVFTLSCTGYGATTTVKSITLLPPGPPTLTLTAMAKTISIPPGTGTNLEWLAKNTATCMASGGWSGSQPASGVYPTGLLTESKIYTLTCPGLSGGSVTKTVTVLVAPYSGPPLAEKFHLTLDPSEVASPVFNTPTTTTSAVTPTFGQLGELSLANGFVTFVPTATGQGSLFTLGSKGSLRTHAFYNFANPDMQSLLSVEGGEIQAVLVGGFGDNFARSLSLSESAADRQLYIFSATTGTAAGTDISYLKFDLANRAADITIMARAPGAPNTPKLRVVLPTEVADAMFAEGMPLRVRLAWDGLAQRLYLNDTLFAAQAYTKQLVVWGAGSRFAIGASLHSSYPTAFWGFRDIIDDVVISAP